MSYSVKFANGTVSAYSSSTACVLAHAQVIRQLNATAGGVIDYAVPSGAGSFDAFRVDGHGNRGGTVDLTGATIASSVAGATVLVDDGSGGNRWRLGTVVSDGNQVLAPDGRPIPWTAPAAAADAANGQALPPVGTVMALYGTASDGSVWFSVHGESVERGGYFTQPMATVGALPPGSVAVVLQGYRWLIVQL